MGGKQPNYLFHFLFECYQVSFDFVQNIMFLNIEKIVVDILLSKEMKFFSQIRPGFSETSSWNR